MKRRYYRYFVCVCVLLYIYYYFGVGDYMLAKSYDDFDYPLNVDVRPLVREVLAGGKASMAPINYYPYRFLTNSAKCKTIERLDLFIVIKSALTHFGHRDAIRRTYGQENLIPGRIVKTLFFLGMDSPPKSVTQSRIEDEMAEYKDIIQIDFHDDYYNSTIKTMMSFRWVYEHCATADYYLFTDDDMYVSVDKVFDYIHDQTFKEKDNKENDLDTNKLKSDSALTDSQSTEEHLFAGYLFDSSPQRFRSSKWRVSLEEYPWDRWPPYITGGAYVVSNISMKYLYIGSLFVKHFKFDDVYLGIVAKKVGLEPRHSPNFHYYKKHYSKEGYRDVIASHGYSDHEEMIRIWNEQNSVNRV